MYLNIFQCMFHEVISFSCIYLDSEEINRKYDFLVVLFVFEYKHCFFVSE